LNALQVTETMAYYSMLRRQRAGKYHVQVCTNVSCMLRGGIALRICPEETRSRPQANHRRRRFSLEEVECLGACTGAPAMQ